VGGKEPAGGHFGSELPLARYAFTASACHGESLLLKRQLKPPPEPNWSVAISSSMVVCFMNRVAPTAVTQGEDAGHEGDRIGWSGTRAVPPEVVVGSAAGPVEVTDE